MANIHTLDDLRRQDEQTSARVLYINETPSQRKRCIDLFFPGWTWKSFIVAISGVQVVVFVVSLTLGSYAMAPNMRSLSALGASYGPPIQRGQVWRLITPLFLHANVWHILFNVFFQIRMGLALEAAYGIPRIAIAYFVTGIAGNVFSVALAPCKAAVGASTAGFGLIGIQMAEIALAWHMIRQKDQAIFNIAFFILLSVLISVGPHSVVDWRGHLGGFIAGFAIGVLYNETMANRPAWYKTGKTVASVTVIAELVACTAVIFAIPVTSRGC